MCKRHAKTFISNILFNRTFRMISNSHRVCVDLRTRHYFFVSAITYALASFLYELRTNFINESASILPFTTNIINSNPNTIRLRIRATSDNLLQPSQLWIVLVFSGNERDSWASHHSAGWAEHARNRRAILFFIIEIEREKTRKHAEKIHRK